MTNAKRAEQIRALAESLMADQPERDRLKRQADESLARLHEAVREFVEGGHRGGDPYGAPKPASS